MTPEEFVERWSEPLLRFEPWQLEGMGLPEDAAVFLTRAGLPAEGGAGLDFYTIGEQTRDGGCHARGWAAGWGVSDEAKARMRRLVCIGEDGGGNPLCLDPENGGAVVLLDHEGDFAPLFVNSSVAQFAECLLADRVLWESGKRVTAEQQARLEAEIRRIDSPALEEHCYWRSYVGDVVDFV